MWCHSVCKRFSMARILWLSGMPSSCLLHQHWTYRMDWPAWYLQTKFVAHVSATSETSSQYFCPWKLESSHHQEFQSNPFKTLKGLVMTENSFWLPWKMSVILIRPQNVFNQIDDILFLVTRYDGITNCRIATAMAIWTRAINAIKSFQKSSPSLSDSIVAVKEEDNNNTPSST